MGEPSGESGEGKQNGEHLGGDAQGLVDDSGVEVNVRVELALDEELVVEGDALQLHGDVDHRFAAHDAEHVISDFANDGSARVEVLVVAVTEAHERLLAVLDILDELGDVIDMADRVQHAEDGLIGATVAGSVESGDGSGEGGVDIGL